MAKGKANPNFTRIEFGIDQDQLKTALEYLTENVAKSLTAGLSKSIGDFGKNLGKSVQVVFDDTILKTLKKPIKITLDTTAAIEQIKDLAKPLQDIVGEAKTKKAKATDETSTRAKAKNSPVDRINELDDLEKRAKSFGDKGFGLEKVVTQLRLSFKLLNDEVGDDSLFSEKQLKTLERFEKRFKDVVKQSDIFERKQAETTRDTLLEKSSVSQTQDNTRIDFDIDDAKQRKINLEKRQTERQKQENAEVDFEIEDAKQRKINLLKKGSERQKQENAEVDFEIQEAKIRRTKALKDAKTLQDQENAQVNFEIDEAKIRKVKAIKDAKRLQDEENARINFEIDEAKARKEKTRKESERLQREENARIDFDIDEAKRRRVKPSEPLDQIKTTGITEKRNFADQLEKQLTKKRSDIARGGSGILLSDVTKKTSTYEQAINSSRVALERLDEQIKKGEVTQDQANKKFKQINETLQKTRIAIEQIDGEKIGKAFKSDEIDRFSKGLSTNLAVLGFTLQRIGGDLQNFGRQAIQSLSQVATAAQPIEQARNIVQKNFVETQKLTQEQGDALVNQLKELADLPGNNLKDTTEQFLRFSDALGDTNVALKLNRGLIALAANTGVDKSNQLTQILLDARTKDKQFNQDSFGKLKSLGGQNVEKVLANAGINTTDDANKIGTAKVIKILADELSKLPLPLLTTADRFNALSNRVAELGESVGKVLSPALTNLNNILKETILPILEKLQKRFDALPDGTKSFISSLALGIPILALLAGGLISLGGAAAFAVSGIIQLKELGKLAKSSLGLGELAEDVGKVAKISTVPADFIGPLPAGVTRETVSTTIKKAPRIKATKRTLATAKKQLDFLDGTASSAGSAFGTESEIAEQSSKVNALEERLAKLTNPQSATDIAGAKLKNTRRDVVQYKDLLEEVKANSIKFGGLDEFQNAVTGELGTDQFARFTKGLADSEKEVVKLGQAFLDTESRIGNSTRSFTGFRNTVLEFVTDTKIKTGFATFGDFFKSIPNLLRAGFLKPFSAIKTAFTSIVVSVKEIGFFKTILTGLSSAFGLVTKGSAGLVGSLAKILGFTNPIGIAINIILSVVTALLSNFNGIRDRVIKVFSDFYASTVRLTKALGLGDGGLLTLLKGLGDVLNVVFGFIGEVVLDILNAIVLTLTDVINNLATMFEYFRNGQIGLGLFEGIKALLNATLGLFKNLAVEIVATLADAVDDILTSIFGGRNGDLGDYVRQINGTDKQSIVDKSVKDSKVTDAEKVINLEKEAQEAAIQKEKERQESIRETIKKLNTAFEKSTENYIKFRLDKVINDLESINNLVEENTQKQIENFKTLGESTLNSDILAGNYAVITESIKENLSQIQSIQSKIGLGKALAEFRTFAESDVLNPIFDATKLNVAGFKELKKSIEDATNSGSIEQLNIALEEVRKNTEKVVLSDPSISGNVYVGVLNAIEKARQGYAGIAKESEKTAITYRKQLSDLEKFQRIRQEGIRAELANIELEARNRKRASDAQISDIKARRDLIILEREGAPEQIVAEQERINQIKKNLEDAKAKIDQLTNQRTNTLGELRANAPIDVNIGDLNRDPRILDLDAQIQEVTVNLNKFEEQYRNTFGEESKSRAIKWFENIGEQISQFNGQLANVEGMLAKSIGRLALGFSDLDAGTTNEPYANAINGLTEELNRLINVTKELPKNSKYVREFRDAIDEMTSGKSLSTEATLERLINAMANAKAEAASLENQKAQKDFSDAAKRSELPFQRTAGAKNDEFKLPQITGASGLNEVVKELGGLNFDKSKLLKVASMSTDNLAKNIKELLEFQGSTGIETDEKLTLIRNLIRTAQDSSQEDLNKVLDAVFNIDGRINFGAIAGEVYAKALKAYDASNKEVQAKIKATIDSRVQIIDNEAILKFEKIDADVAIQEALLEDLNKKLETAGATERRTLLKQQSDILVALTNFKFERLDIEAAFNIQKAIEQANGNKLEIKQIEIAGKLRREAIQIERQKEFDGLIESGRVRTDKNGKPIDADGKIIVSPDPIKVKKLEVKSGSAEVTDTTIPKSGTDPATPTVTAIGGLAQMKADLDGIGNKARQVANDMTALFDRLASGEGVLNSFKNTLGKLGKGTADIKDIFKEFAIFGVTAFASAFGSALVGALSGTEDFLTGLKKFFGEILIALGQQLIALGVAGLAFAALALFGIAPPKYALGVPAAIGAIAAGTGLIIAGSLLSGGGNKKGAEASNTSAGNSANSSAGNSGQAEYDAEKDKTAVYQKALASKILIEVRTDNVNLVKKFIRATNRDPRLGNILDSRRTGFAL